jgi:hypothetical protein
LGIQNWVMITRIAQKALVPPAREEYALATF